MIEPPTAKNPDDKAANTEQLDALQVWTDWLQQSATVGADIVHLLQLELQLAIKDSKRLLLLALIFIPVLILTWIGFTLLLAWLVYLLDTSVTQGLLAFFIVQLGALSIILMSWKHYKKSLSLPLTTAQISKLVGGQSSDT